MNERTPLGLPEVADLLDQSPSTRKAILVGGQALNVLAVHYNLDAIATAVSGDIDFFGNAALARKAGKAWSGRTRRSSMDDHTPNSALVLVEIHGQTHQIDFMSQILGVHAEELEDWAATIKVDGKTFRIMHPLHVLQSQLENVYGVLNRRRMGPRAVSRTNLAVRVVERALRDYLDGDDIRAALKAAERVAEIATTKAGLRAWYGDGLDPLTAIPSHVRWPGEFLEKRLPQIREIVSKQREQYAHQQTRVSTKSGSKSRLR